MQQPTRDDPVAGALSEAYGGPSGEHVRPHPWWTPVRVLLAVFTVVFAVGLLQKYPCASTDWSDTDLRYRAMCYSDIPYLYTGRGFAEHRWPYSDDDGRYPTMEYPPVISYAAWAISLVTPQLGPPQSDRAAGDTDALWGLPGMSREVNAYVLLTAVSLFAAGLGAVLFLAGASPERPWDAMGFVLSPALLFAGLVNWDLYAVLFVAAALFAWSRGRPGSAGVLVGLGVATKLYPLFLLGAFAIDAIRRGRHEEIPRMIGGAAGAWIVANLPALLTGHDAWRVFWSFNSDRGADLGSLWLVAAQLGVDVTAETINLVSLALFAIACAAILVLGLLAPKRPRVTQVAFLIVAAFLLVNKVYSPQYVLWLLPLAALAVPRWRDLLIWQAGELIYFGAVWLYLGGWLEASSGGQAPAYHVAILVRVAAELYLVARVVGDVWTADPVSPCASAHAGCPGPGRSSVRAP